MGLIWTWDLWRSCRSSRSDWDPSAAASASHLMGSGWARTESLRCRQRSLESWRHSFESLSLFSFCRSFWKWKRVQGLQLPAFLFLFLLLLPVTNGSILCVLGKDLWFARIYRTAIRVMGGRNSYRWVMATDCLRCGSKWEARHVLRGGLPHASDRGRRDRCQRGG